MNVSQDEVMNYLLVKCIELEATVLVLRASVGSLIQIVKPEAAEEFSKVLEQQIQKQREGLLVDHRFGDISDMLSLIYPPAVPPEDEQ